MKITPIALTAMAFVIAASDVSVAQSSFNCRRPRSETAATICANPQLAERDRQVDAAYQQALQSAAEPNRVRDNHTAWANNLSICGTDRQCLAEMLDEELDALKYASRSGREVEEPPARNAQAQPQIDARSDPPIRSVDDRPFERADDQPPVETVPTRKLPSETTETSPAAPAATAEQFATSQPDHEGSEWDKAAFGGLLLIPILAIIAALLATKSLAEHTTRRFNWPLILNWWNVLYLVGIFGGLFVSTFAGPAGGLGLFGAICAVMLIVNIIKTNVLTGITMTVVQPLVVVIMWFCYCLARGQIQGRRP